MSTNVVERIVVQQFMENWGGPGKHKWVETDDTHFPQFKYRLARKKTTTIIEYEVVATMGEFNE